ncbi:iron uptake porin [Tumidithrix elongata RA019]|uniref:Iron uptake porin n=1 Tax=Tumidithrix elongata BACA0141 TaxID=2716417 RepID=A0AAW9Q5H9_9CYAN|nr:iron uptake porin [Tumidithrix elongata RA019]
MKGINFNYRLIQNASCLACLSFLAFTASANAEVKATDPSLTSATKVSVQPDASINSKDSSVVVQATTEVVTPSSSVMRRDLAVPTVNSQTAQTTNVSQLLPQVTTLSKEGDGSRSAGKMAQVTSVSQLSDVKPTDWAFTALQSLVERYGCIAGYPDRTYRGQRAMTRYEFAAGLNACLDKINEIISAGLADKVSKEDLAALQKLQEEFAAELATLRGRVDALEAKTATLEAQQFSTTTKLGGLVFFNLTGASGGNNVKFETGARVGGVPVVGTATKPNLTFSGLAWLTLKTSFTGSDILTTQLAMGNGTSPYNAYNGFPTTFTFFNSTGVPFTDQTAGINSNQVVLRELSYQFPVFEKASLVVGARVNFYKYFDNNRFTLFLNGTSSFNSIDSTLLTNAKRGAGVVFMTPLGQNFDFKIGYLAEDNEFLPGPRSASDPNQGLFGGNNALTAEIGFKPSDNFTLRLLYSRTNLQALFGQVGGVGATPSLPGLADDGVTGAGLSNGQSDVFVANFDWLVTKGFGLFGRYGISSTNLNKTTGGSAGSVTTQAFQFGLAFPDLFKDGALGTLSLVMPYNFTGGRNLLVAGAGDGGVQYDLEAAYSLPITKNITLVPAAYLILNPNNFSSNPSVFVGNLRMQFSF